MSTPVIEVEHLTVSYRRRRHTLTAVRDLSFRVDRGEILAIVGESGSGETTTAHALLGLLPSNATIDGGRIVVTVVEYKGEGVRIGVQAPASVRIDRQEVFERIQEVR